MAPNAEPAEEDSISDQYYNLAAGFLLDPTTDDLSQNTTLYRSSIFYQQYFFIQDQRNTEFFETVRFPITGKSALVLFHDMNSSLSI